MTATKRRTLTAEEKAAGFLIEKIGGPEHGKWYGPATRPLPPGWALTRHGRPLGIYASLSAALEVAALEFAEDPRQNGGRAAAARRKNPSRNDPELTVATLKLRRLGPGHYEHLNARTKTGWSIFHHTGEFRGENEWVYMRTDDDAWTSHSESRPQDTYATKRDAVEALVDRLRYRR